MSWCTDSKPCVPKAVDQNRSNQGGKTDTYTTEVLFVTGGQRLILGVFVPVFRFQKKLYLACVCWSTLTQQKRKCDSRNVC